MGVVTELSFKNTVKEQFPNVVLRSVNDTTPLVVKLLEKGELPLVGILGDIRKVVAYISPSAYNIEKLLRTHDDIVYNRDENTRVQIRSVVDYLEVV